MSIHMNTIKELLATRSLFTVNNGTTIYSAVCYMAEQNIGIVPVLGEAGKLLGVFSERDLVRRVIAKDLDVKSVTVDEIMTKDLILADISESYEECLKKMQSRHTRHIIIIENEKFVGILSMRDLLELDVTIQKETIEVLHNYIYSK
jgi:CBS domain-containing protein